MRTNDKKYLIAGIFDDCDDMFYYGKGDVFSDNELTAYRYTWQEACRAADNDFSELGNKYIHIVTQSELVEIDD